MFASILYIQTHTQTHNHTNIHQDDELANAITEAEAKAPEDLTDQDKMALMGRPKIGDITRAQLRIKESKEFKVSEEHNFADKNKNQFKQKKILFGLSLLLLF